MLNELATKELKNIKELEEYGEKAILLLSKNGTMKVVELPEYCDIKFSVQEGNIQLIHCTIKQKI